MILVLVRVVDEQPDRHEEMADAAVVAQRMRRLMSLGYCDAEALVLAQAGVDVRAVARLIDRGCPLDIAARIVL